MLLETPRLVLRRFRAEDAVPLAAYRSDPAVARYQSWTAPVPLETADRIVRALAEGSLESPGWFQYAIELKADGCLVGDVGVCLHENLMQASIGFTLAADRQGHGYAAEAVGAVLDDLFGRRGLHRVSAECDARNTRSARLLLRLGFVQEGLLRQASWLKGEWTDDLQFGLLSSDRQAAAGR
ncbi:N-acetyltransferase [Streptomyces tauricus]|uniref:GNAT family N-acetyltransferase n=1 Tax=Streptomyces tauricus TaxID=68274 RepID=A0ABZ1JSL3_9ACTN|nr:GNAT family protein [Streptomyces tauricus]MCW8096013.1 GNAT family N-acetyltransferase [Streptomyces tauricus]GHA05188.1 N-acetyltransferase [Streptomyces tauricus]